MHDSSSINYDIASTDRAAMVTARLPSSDQGRSLSSQSLNPLQSISPKNLPSKRVETEEDVSDDEKDSSEDDKRFYIDGQRLMRPVRIANPNTIWMNSTSSSGFQAILNDREYGGSIIMLDTKSDTQTSIGEQSSNFEGFLIPESARKVVRQRMSTRLAGSFDMTNQVKVRANQTS